MHDAQVSIESFSITLGSMLILNSEDYPYVMSRPWMPLSEIRSPHELDPTRQDWGMKDLCLMPFMRLRELDLMLPDLRISCTAHARSQIIKAVMRLISTGSSQLKKSSISRCRSNTYNDRLFLASLSEMTLPHLKHFRLTTIHEDNRQPLENFLRRHSHHLQVIRLVDLHSGLIRADDWIERVETLRHLRWDCLHTFGLDRGTGWRDGPELKSFLRHISDVNPILAHPYRLT